MKDVRDKEREYKEVSKYCHGIVEKLYPRLSEEKSEWLAKEATWGVCAKLRKGYKVSSLSLGVAVYHNNLRQVIKRAGLTNMSYAVKLMNIIDNTTANLEYRRSRSKSENEEE